MNDDEQSKTWSRFCAGVEVACGIVIALLVLAVSLAFAFSISGCTNAVLEGPDGATEDVGVVMQGLWITETTINSNFGQSLNNSSCKTSYLRGYAMTHQCGSNNCFTCSADECRQGNSNVLVFTANACVDLSSTLRRCEYWKHEGQPFTVHTKVGWFTYPSTCNTQPLPKASLMFKTLSDLNNNTPFMRVFNQPTNRLEVLIP